MSAILDAEVLDILVEAIGVEATRGVIELFIGECGELAAAMAAPGATSAAIGRAAHSLKSSAGQLGALALSEAALAVETAAGANPASLPPLIATLAECAARTQTTLGEWLK